jgi:hypothetical protein
MTFALSVIALILGPFVYSLAQRSPTARQVLDGFIFITIAGIVCVHIIPEAIETGGLYAIVFLLLGLAFPIVIERYFHSSLHEAHVFILVLAALGLTLHATIDGIALLPFHDPAERAAGADVPGSLFGNQLALGVILHRLPVGMAIWWSVRISFGVPVAVATFMLIIAATAAAYFLGESNLPLVETASVSYFQAFVAGSLVHIVAFGVSHDHGEKVQAVSSAKDWGYRVGILIGMFLVGSAPHFYT